MRIEMKKFLFIGSRIANSYFFEKAQKCGRLEFISVTNGKQYNLPKYINDLKLAINELKHQQVDYEQKTVEKHDVQQLVNDILTIKRSIEDCHESIRLTKGEILRVSPLGDFDINDVKELKLLIKKEIQFFYIKRLKLIAEKIPEELIYINSEYDFDYYLYIGDDRFTNLFFSEIICDRSLKYLLKDLKQLEANSREKEIKLKNSASYLNCLCDYLVGELNEINLKFAKEEITNHLDQQLFAVEAWIPNNQIKYIKDLISDIPIFYQEVAIEKNDKIPTYLENKNMGAVGQDIVEIYDTPSTTDRDPSSFVIWAFAIFFGMIISDAGYGLLFLSVSLYLWGMFGKKWSGLKKRMLKLLTLMSFTTIIWGVMVASYFSIKMEPDNQLNRISLLYHLAYNKIDYNITKKSETFSEWTIKYPNLTNTLDPAIFLQNGKVNHGSTVKFSLMENLYDGILLEIAILVGIIHLSLSFLRNLYRNWSGIGWILMLFGGYLYFPYVLGSVSIVNYMGFMQVSTSTIIGIHLLYSGFGLAIILALIQEKWKGIGVVFKLIEIFADTLSYLRLYALGLASMVMAATFNEIGIAFGGLGFIIILLGHIVNISLGIMAGVIHGLRLNFLEWYHHSFEGGGKKFNPLRLMVRE